MHIVSFVLVFFLLALFTSNWLLWPMSPGYAVGVIAFVLVTVPLMWQLVPMDTASEFLAIILLLSAFFFPIMVVVVSEEGSEMYNVSKKKKNTNTVMNARANIIL